MKGLRARARTIYTYMYTRIVWLFPMHIYCTSYGFMGLTVIYARDRRSNPRVSVRDVKTPRMRPGR